MKISVCVGSSCHLKGSYNIINLMKDNLEKNGLTDKVELAASFCLGKCTHGVSVKINDEVVTGITPENFNEMFSEKVLGGLKNEQ